MPRHKGGGTEPGEAPAAPRRRTARGRPRRSRARRRALRYMYPVCCVCALPSRGRPAGPLSARPLIICARRGTRCSACTRAMRGGSRCRGGAGASTHDAAERQRAQYRPQVRARAAAIERARTRAGGVPRPAPRAACPHRARCGALLPPAPLTCRTRRTTRRCSWASARALCTSVPTSSTRRRLQSRSRNTAKVCHPPHSRTRISTRPLHRRAHQAARGCSVLR